LPTAPAITIRAIVFRGLDPDQIDQFVRSDPYGEAGLVTGWRIEPWTIV
jgi:hypothetical protein